MTQTTELTAEYIREFVLAGHGNLARVQALLAETPALLNAAYEWKENDSETAIQGAAHVGNSTIAEYLLAHGAPLDICAAAMLGRQQDVERFVDADPTAIVAVGAHGIPLLAHSAWSGNVDLVTWLVERGASQGTGPALNNAVNRGHAEVTAWLLQHAEPELAWKNFQGKTALQLAIEHGSEPLVQLLRAHGATE